MTAPIPTFSILPLGSLGDIVPFGGEADPLGIMKFFSGVFAKLEPVRQGKVVLYNPNTHTAKVLVEGSSSEWPCVFADEPLAFSFGYSSTYPAREGDMVLVRQLARGVASGIIIGRVPYYLDFVNGDAYNDPDKYHRMMFTQKPDTRDINVPGMMKPIGNNNDNSTHIATHFRATDVYPGEFANVNQHNCGIKGGLFSTTLLGGGASLRLSALSNLARLTCESYQRYSMHGSLHEFHNGRFLSSERNLSMYQEERLGWHSPDSGSFSSNVWTKDSEAPKGGENQTARPRIKELTGFFGHLISKYCFRPDPNETGIRVQGKGSPNEEGVFRESVDPSGQYRLSASGMLAIERTGRIPVPVRQAYPTDNGHEVKKDANGKPEVLKPFEHDDKDPCYRQLELFDRQAYDLKNQYSRVDGLGADKPDYHVPDEKDLKPLDDEYDKRFFGNKTVKLKEFDKRRAGVYMGEDGSVIIRDAWGSEIVMLCGNISISCAGNVMTFPGQTALTIAGDDIVHKAQNSVDIHASAHDVRLSAARNMEILGGGDENRFSGGVIIESRGKSAASWNGKDRGEDARLSGITLRTNNQAIVIDGKNLNLRSRKATRLISGDGDIDGNISIAARRIRSKAKMTLLSSDTSHMLLSQAGFFSAAQSIGLFAKQSFAVTKGEKYPVPFQWADVQNIAEKLIPMYDKFNEDLGKEKDASGGFDKNTLDLMMFGFRKSTECRTDRPWSIGGKGKFKLYQPAWAQVMGIYDTLKGIKSKKYEENAEWSNGMPFPGKEAKSSAQYAKLSGDGPKNLAKDGGYNKPRKEVKDKSDIETTSLEDGYLIRK